MGEQRNVTNKMILSVAAIGFVMLVAFWIIVGLFQQHKSQYEFALESHWTVVRNETVLYEDVDIIDANFAPIVRGDVLELSCTIPETADIGYTVQILVHLCAVEAYVDDVQIYSYGLTEYEKNEMIGSGYHFITLPSNVAGHTLKIKCIMNEDNAFTSIIVPRCTKTEYARVNFARSQMINMTIGLFLLGLGIILSGVSIVASFYNGIYKRLVFIGLFSTCMGSYTLQSNKIFEVFTTDLLVGSQAEYLSLYLAPVPFALLMLTIREDDRTWRRIVIIAMTSVTALFPIVASILHYTNIIRFPKILSFFHIIGFTCISIISIAGYVTVKDKTRAESITAVAVLMLLGILALDIGRFNLQKFILPNFDMLMNSFIPLGTLTFVIMLLVSYLMYLYDMVMTKTEKDTLTRLAYHDVLTGLYNRTKYEAVLSELDESTKEFALISIDLNDLKYVNDTYGHNKGDLMLTTFAMILKNNFDKIGMCFRTGGDEYIIIIEDNHISDISQALINMNMDEAKESENQIFEIRASYGIAYRSEIDDGQAFKVFRLADRRMYEMKSQAKGKEYVFGSDKDKTATK